MYDKTTDAQSRWHSEDYSEVADTYREGCKETVRDYRPMYDDYRKKPRSMQSRPGALVSTTRPCRWDYILPAVAFVVAGVLWSPYYGSAAATVVALLCIVQALLSYRGFATHE